jgi:hypothetical protein
VFVETVPGDELPARVLFTQPNPSHAGSCFHYSQRDEGRVAVTLYTAGGRLVRTIAGATTAAVPESGREDALCWDGLDEDGRPAASGVYLWQLSHSGSKVFGQSGAVTIIR